MVTPASDAGYNPSTTRWVALDAVTPTAHRPGRRLPGLVRQIGALYEVETDGCNYASLSHALRPIRAGDRVDAGAVISGSGRLKSPRRMRFRSAAGSLKNRPRRAG